MPRPRTETNSPDRHFGGPVGTRHVTSVNNLGDLIYVENTVSMRRQLAKRRRSGLELHGHRTIASGILPMADGAEIFVIQGAHLDLFSQRFGFFSAALASGKKGTIPSRIRISLRNPGLFISF